jgi:hypothetical protein
VVIRVIFSQAELVVPLETVDTRQGVEVAPGGLVRMAELVQLGGLEVVREDRESVSVSRVILSEWEAAEVGQGGSLELVQTVADKVVATWTRLAHSRQPEQLEPAAAAAAVHTRSRPMQGFSNNPGMVVLVQ